MSWKISLPNKLEMFKLLTYFNREEMLMIPTKNNKLLWLRTGHDSFTATSCIMSVSALTIEPTHKNTLETWSNKLHTNYRRTGEEEFCLFYVNPEKHCVILFKVRFNFKISTASLVVELHLIPFLHHLVVFCHVAA